MNSKKINVHPHIRHPRRHVSREVYREADRNEVLDLFNNFVREARKEFRKYDRLGMKGRINKRDCEAVTFVCSSFSLNIDFKGGMRV